MDNDWKMIIDVEGGDDANDDADTDADNDDKVQRTLVGMQCRCQCLTSGQSLLWRAARGGHFQGQFTTKLTHGDHLQFSLLHTPLLFVIPGVIAWYHLVSRCGN